MSIERKGTRTTVNLSAALFGIDKGVEEGNLTLVVFPAAFFEGGGGPFRNTGGYAMPDADEGDRFWYAEPQHLREIAEVCTERADELEPPAISPGAPQVKFGDASPDHKHWQFHRSYVGTRDQRVECGSWATFQVEPSARHDGGAFVAKVNVGWGDGVTLTAKELEVLAAAALESAAAVRKAEAEEAVA